MAGPISLFGKLSAGATTGFVKGKMYQDERAKEDRRQSILERRTDLQEGMLGLQGEQFEEQKKQNYWTKALAFANAGQYDKADIMLRDLERSEGVDPMTYGMFEAQDDWVGIQGNEENIVFYQKSKDPREKGNTHIIKIPPTAAKGAEATNKRLTNLGKQIEIQNKAISNLESQWGVKAPEIKFNDTGGVATISMSKGDKSGFYKSLVEWAYKDIDSADTPAEQKTIAAAREALGQYESMMIEVMALAASAQTSGSARVRMENVVEQHMSLTNAMEGKPGIKTLRAKQDMGKLAGGAGATPGQTRRFVQDVGTHPEEVGERPLESEYQQKTIQEFIALGLSPDSATEEQIIAVDKKVSRELNISPGTYLR